MIAEEGIGYRWVAATNSQSRAVIAAFKAILARWLAHHRCWSDAPHLIIVGGKMAPGLVMTSHGLVNELVPQ